MKALGLIAILLLALVACSDQMTVLQKKPTPVPTLTALATKMPPATALPPSATSTTEPTIEATATELPPTETVTPTVEVTFTATITAAPEVTVTSTLPATPEVTPTVTVVGVPIAPFPDAPACPEHDNETFHTLWNEQEGCHYDHEHGDTPFTAEVGAAFPGYDLNQLLGTDGIGHTNPSSGMENTHKHGGFKWSVNLTHLEGCTPFEGARNGVDASAILFHGMGDYAMELEASVHSAVALLRFCGADGPGYMYVVQHVTYGQVVIPYQGPFVAPYPYTVNAPHPQYGAGFGPYISVDCVGPVLQCRSSLEFIRTRRLASASFWTTKTTGTSNPLLRPENSGLFRPFWRVRDAYQVFDWTDQTHPFTYLWVCGGAMYDPAGCEYNNSTTQIHEIAGTIPADWDGLANWDTNDAPGYVSAEGFVTRYGDLNTACTEAGEGCHPIVLENVPVGTYGSLVVNFPANKLPPNIVPLQPERDIYFCGEEVCQERDPGAAPSGWLGPNN